MIIRRITLWNINICLSTIFTWIGEKNLDGGKLNFHSKFVSFEYLFSRQYSFPIMKKTDDYSQNYVTKYKYLSAHDFLCGL